VSKQPGADTGIGQACRNQVLLSDFRWLSVQETTFSDDFLEQTCVERKHERSARPVTDANLGLDAASAFWLLLRQVREHRVFRHRMYEKYTSGKITLYTAAKARSAACDLDRIAASAFDRDFPDSILFHELVQNVELDKPIDIEVDSELVRALSR